MDDNDVMFFGEGDDFLEELEVSHGCGRIMWKLMTRSWAVERSAIDFCNSLKKSLSGRTQSL